MSDHISPSEQEKLDQFQTITAFKDEEYDKIVALLRNNWWNLEVALSKYFDGGLDREAARTPPPTEANVQHTTHGATDQFATDGFNGGHDVNPAFGSNSFNQDDFWSQLNNQTPNQLLASQGMLPQLPIMRPLSNKWKIQPGLNISATQNLWNQFAQSPILFIILLIPRTLTLLLTAIGWLFSFAFPSSPDYVPEKPTLESFDFTKHFETILADRSDITVHRGDFNDAFFQAKTETKFLLVILIGDNEPSTAFLKKVLSNSTVSNIIKEEHIIVYAGNVNESQSFELAKNLKTVVTPSVYLVGNVASGPNAIASMSVLSRIPVKSSNAFFNKLRREVERYKPEFITRKIEQDELNYSRQIKELQDQAYQESLIADKIKQEKKDAEKQERLQKEQEENFRKENKLKYLASLQGKYEDLSSLPKGDFTNIRFKLPSGEHVMQKFSKDHKLQDIYSFIALKLHTKSLSEEELEEFQNHPTDVHEEYIHVFPFEIISPFPRYVVPVGEDKLVKDVNQLWPNGSVLIEYLEDNEEEDDEEEEGNDE